WLGDQVRCCCPAGCGAQDEDPGLLDAVDRKDVRRLPFVRPRRAPGAGLVAAVGALARDHLRPEVGQEPGRVGRGEAPTGGGATHALERTRGDHRKAACPVSSRPMTSWCTSLVPSSVSTDSRLLAWRMIGYSRVMPAAPRIVRDSRAMPMASRTLFS